MTEASLPRVIGPTENTLRQLLVHVLRPTGIDGYAEWVVLNRIAAGPVTTDELTAVLGVDADAGADTGAAVVARLMSKGLILELTLTGVGRGELARARRAVGLATADLVDGVDPADQEIARRVLDHLRERAEAALALG